MGHDTLVGKTTYTSLPYLISLPMWDDETQSWTYDLLTSPKPNKTTSGSSQDADKDKTSNGTGNTTGTTGGASTVWQKHAQTGEELSYWLSYAIIGLALIKVGKTLRHHGSES